MAGACAGAYTRRTRARLLGSVYIASVILGTTASAAPAADVAPGMHLIAGTTGAGAQPDGNSILIDAPEGLIVFDTGRHPAHTQRVLDFAAAAGTPVRAIVNSHWHLDHVGGNVLIRRAYPTVDVYATGAIEDALTGFLAAYRRQLQNALTAGDGGSAAAEQRAEIALIDAGDQLKPTHIVAESGSMMIAGRPLQLHVEHAAVTAGDLWVFDPRTRVLLAGDLVTLPAPFLDTACPRRWRSALRHLARAPFALLVPGHGAPMTPGAFRSWRHAFAGLLACAEDPVQPGRACVEGWQRDTAALVPQEDRGYGHALTAYYVDKILRGDPMRWTAACRSG